MKHRERAAFHNYALHTRLTKKSPRQSENVPTGLGWLRHLRL